MSSFGNQGALFLGEPKESRKSGFFSKRSYAKSHSKEQHRGGSLKSSCFTCKGNSLSVSWRSRDVLGLSSGMYVLVGDIFFPTPLYLTVLVLVGTNSLSTLVVSLTPPQFSLADSPCSACLVSGPLRGSLLCHTQQAAFVNTGTLPMQPPSWGPAPIH